MSARSQRSIILPFLLTLVTGELFSTQPASEAAATAEPAGLDPMQRVDA